MQQRKEEILAKKARLAELKKQNELRNRQFSATRQSLGDASELIAPTPGRADNRVKLETLISSLVGDSRPGSAGPRDAGSGPHSLARGSRPNSVLSAGDISLDNADLASPTGVSAVGAQSRSPTITLQKLSTAPLATVFEFSPSPVKEVFSYSKGVQTTEPWSPPLRDIREDFSDSDGDGSPSAIRSPRNSKRLSRRKDEELRNNIRKEIEEELQAIKEPSRDGLLSGMVQGSKTQNFPVRALTNEELNAVTSSEDFLDFVERSSKVIERALDEEYDVLADYAHRDSYGMDDEDDGYGSGKGKGGKKVREHAQFYDEKWSKRRMITGIDFSPKFPELVLASYTKNSSAPHEPPGVAQVWNLHLHDRAEYVFNCPTDLLTAKFSPFHPSLIVGGGYSGQVFLWDTRAKASPVQRTPLTNVGHTHPVYSIQIVGTQNANNIISCSTDGAVCGWTVDMLAQPQEYLELITPPPTKAEDLAPTCMAFPQADPTYFLVGTEEGSVYPCHRYDRAGAKAGIEQRIRYKGHAAPVMSIDFHPARGPIDLGDLVLTSSLDWTVKLWRARTPATISSIASTNHQQSRPLLEFTREDVVYDAAWSPVKPGIFALVDGSGCMEVWDITYDTEVPVARTSPTTREPDKRGGTKSLNKVAWEQTDGKRLAVGGMAGVLTVYEVGNDLGGAEYAKAEEWAAVKKMVSKLDAAVLPAQTNGLNGF